MKFCWAVESGRYLVVSLEVELLLVSVLEGAKNSEQVGTEPKSAPEPAKT